MRLQGRVLELAQLFIIVCPSFVLFGYNQAGLGSLLNLSDWIEHFPEIDTVNTTGKVDDHNATIKGLIVATFTLGALGGALLSGYTGDKFGHRWAIFGAAILTLLGEILECSAFRLLQLVVGRVAVGAGVGMLSGTVPTWQSECVRSENRGRHVVLDGLFISLGYVLQAWVNLGFYEFHTGPLTWRPSIAIAMIFSLAIIASIFSFPDSPRWLMQKNRSLEARDALSRYKGLPTDSTEIALEISLIEKSLEETSQTAVSLKDLLKMGEDKLFYRFGLCILLQFFQQWAGGNLISIYSTIIFEDGLDMDSYTARLLSGGTLTWKFLSCFVAFFTIDHFGRRIALMVSGGGMAMCMICMAITTSFPTTNYPSNIACVFFIFLFNFFTPIGFLGANFLYCTEVAPLRLRNTMVSISTANHWLWNFVITMISPIAVAKLGYLYYIVFACIGVCIPVAVYILYPETMGRTLEEIDLIFRESPSVLGTVSYARRTSMKKRQAELHDDHSSEDKMV